MFFDFLSAFNTIGLAVMGEKLMQVDALHVSWIVSYLTGKPQYVHFQYCVSDRVVSNTRAPQGTVLLHHRLRLPHRVLLSAVF